MIDAWGKIPAGVFYGNLLEFGNFDECLSVQHNSNIENIGDIMGQYCIARVDITNLTSVPDQRAAMPSAGGG